MTNTNKKRSRAKYDCPDGIRDLIKFVNQAPSRTLLDNSTAIWRQFPFEPPLGIDSAKRQEHSLQYHINIFNQCFQGFSEETKQNILKGAEEWVLKFEGPLAEPFLTINKLFRSINEWYDDFVWHHNLLLGISRFFEHLRNGNFVSVDRRTLKTASGEVIRLPDLFTPLTREETIGCVENALTLAFHGTDLDRIRQCAICPKFFWAQRMESQTCSKQHRDVLNQRKHRLLKREGGK